MDDQPVPTSLVRLIARWGFVARPVHQAEQLPVKLREAAGVRSIQDHLAKQRPRPRVFHELTSEEFSPAYLGLIVYHVTPAQPQQPRLPQ